MTKIQTVIVISAMNWAVSDVPENWLKLGFGASTPLESAALNSNHFPDGTLIPHRNSINHAAGQRLELVVIDSDEYSPTRHIGSATKYWLPSV
jgi:hypothetical protein